MADPLSTSAPVHAVLERRLTGRDSERSPCEIGQARIPRNRIGPHHAPATRDGESDGPALLSAHGLAALGPTLLVKNDHPVAPGEAELFDAPRTDVVGHEIGLARAAS